MLYPLKVVDIELSKPITTITGLGNYMGVCGLVRLHGAPIGYIDVQITSGEVSAKVLSKEILEKHHLAIIKRLLQNGLASDKKPKALQIEDLFDVMPSEGLGAYPLVTVAVCTRDRAKDLQLCLDAICQLNYPKLDLLVIDNAPTTTATAQLIKNHFPLVR